MNVIKKLDPEDYTETYIDFCRKKKEDTKQLLQEDIAKYEEPETKKIYYFLDGDGWNISSGYKELYERAQFQAGLLMNEQTTADQRAKRLKLLKAVFNQD